MSKGRLWLPAKLTVARHNVRITTAEGLEEFKPHRIVWQGPDAFLITGLDKNTTIKRTTLRFQSPESAHKAASAIKEIQTILEEPLVLTSEIGPFDIRTIYSIPIVLSASLHFAVAGGFLILVVLLVYQGQLGGSIFLGLFALYMAWKGRIILKVLRQNARAWLRRNDHHLIIRTQHNWVQFMPTRVEWKSPTIFRLKARGNLVELSFASSEEATTAASTIKALNPKWKRRSHR